MLPSLADFGDLGPGCPWADLIRRYPPNVKWCEAPICAWVREPANTWSNLAYVLLGVWMMLQARREGRGDGPGESAERGRLATIFGAAAIVVGLTSGVYHASTNFLTQVLDFVGMYVFAGLPLLLNLHRLGLLRRRLPVAGYVALVVVLTALTPLVRAAGLPIQGIVALLVLGILATEGLLAARGEAAPRRVFLLALALLTLGALASASDAARLVCDPSSHVLQGHAIWHVLTALSLVAQWRFYRDALFPA